MAAEFAAFAVADRMVALYRAIETRVRELNPTAPRLELLSLYEGMRLAMGKSGERWRNLTYAKTTTLDEELRELLWKLLSLYEEVAASALAHVAAAETPLAVSWRNTYLRGKASANFVLLNMSGTTALIPPDVLLAELGVVVGCALQLSSIAALARPPSILEEAGVA